MNIHLENIKKLIDVCVAKGVFANAESVENANNSYKALVDMEKEYIRLKKKEVEDHEKG